MNTKAKQRAQSRQTESVESDPEGPPTQVAPLAPLTAPEGPQIFDVEAESAGERLDRFLGQAAAARRIALSRTRLKALIEAGEVSVDGAVARDQQYDIEPFRSAQGVDRLGARLAATNDYDARSHATLLRWSMTFRANRSADVGFWPVKNGASQTTYSASGGAAL